MPLSPIDSINAFYAAIVRKDVDAICASYVPGNDTYVFVEGPRYSTLGTDKIFKGWRDFNAAPMALESIIWTEGPFSKQSSDMAWVAGIVRLGLNVKGKLFEQQFRMTFVLRQNAEGIWQIEQEHASAPLADPYGIGDWLKT
jgi:ketosteroid isomerase-like protein